MYRGFVRAFFKTARPANDYLRKHKELELSNRSTEPLNVFHTLKFKLINLLRWPFRIHTDHTWSVLIHLHMVWALSCFNSRTTAIWMSREQLDTKVGRSIRQKKTTWQPMDSDLPWHRLPGLCAHRSKTIFLNINRTTLLLTECIGARLRMDV